MEEYEEDEESFDDELETYSFDDEEEEDDPKGTAFMRGVEEAVKIRDSNEGEEEY
ncbi:hypothetical protein KY359_05970 [Candidatus Woesearchaeota archaeon]|nr:hypothetical protein [Candidatus Woesearchaeota archaeon]